MERYNINYTHDEKLLNLYNKPLKKCKSNMFMSNGSWDKKGKCSEKGGGVHQICIKNISKNAKDFSAITSQSDWSEKRGFNNHCVCLGAWSLYVNIKKEEGENITEKILKCDSIPKNSLSDYYVNKWNKWNGYEEDNQIVDGVNKMVELCQTNNNIKNKNLIDNYCKFSKNKKNFEETKFFKKNCT